jgi:hypothetical protein
VFHEVQEDSGIPASTEIRNAEASRPGAVAVVEMDDAVS